MRPHLGSTITWFALALTTVAAPQAQSQPTVATAGSTLPYIYSNYTFPSDRTTVARHTLRLAIPASSQPVSALKLTAPAGFKLHRRVEAFENQTGVRLPISVNIDRQTAELSFDRAVQPGTAIDLELNYVGIWGLERYYDLAAKFVNSDRYISLGRTDLRRS